MKSKISRHERASLSNKNLPWWLVGFETALCITDCAFITAWLVRQKSSRKSRAALRKLLMTYWCCWLPSLTKTILILNGCKKWRLLQKKEESPEGLKLTYLLCSSKWMIEQRSLERNICHVLLPYYVVRILFWEFELRRQYQPVERAIVSLPVNVHSNFLIWPSKGKRLDKVKTYQIRQNRLSKWCW